MNYIFAFILMSSCFYLSSCSSQQEIVTSYPFLNGSENSENSDTVVTILFSDEHNHRKEHNYYDALIDAQQKYPNKISNVNIVPEAERELIDYYEVDSYPTLILVQDMDVKLRIEGIQEYSLISSKLEVILQDKQEAS
jgi:hypothetical protein